MGTLAWTVEKGRTRQRMAPVAWLAMAILERITITVTSRGPHSLETVFGRTDRNTCPDVRLLEKLGRDVS